jgi:sirohydrochlorin ferrochelatase
MKVALVDNGSLEPAAHRALRAAAAAIGERTGTQVQAVSWRHSDRIRGEALRGGSAWTLEPWIRAQLSEGEREFLFVPFFISPQGSIGSSLRRDLEKLREETGGFAYSFAEGLSADSELPWIVAELVREAAVSGGLRSPAVVVVDHGGPSQASARIRNRVAERARELLQGEIGPLAAASMESPDGPEYSFNQPLLSEALAFPGFDSGDVLIAPLFLLPGRHAGPGGDLERIARAAQTRSPLLRWHFARLVGSHPAAIESLARSLSAALRVGAHP